MRALNTMRQVMPSRLRHRLSALEFTAIPGGIAPAALDAVSPAVLIAISTAAHTGEVLRFDYADHHPVPSPEPPPPRKVEPHHLVTWRERWYLVAWDLDRNDWRMFRADRKSVV